jgi:hypothetical protein
VPSADTLGRVAAGLSPEEVRKLLRRRNKGLKALPFGVRPVMCDGHEATGSAHCYCAQCLTRTVHTAPGDHTQYYHRYVAARLAGPGCWGLLDVEAQAPERRTGRAPCGC